MIKTKVLTIIIVCALVLCACEVPESTGNKNEPAATETLAPTSISMATPTPISTPTYVPTPTPLLNVDDYDYVYPPAIKMAGMFYYGHLEKPMNKMSDKAICVARIQSICDSSQLPDDQGVNDPKFNTGDDIYWDREKYYLYDTEMNKYWVFTKFSDEGELVPYDTDEIGLMRGYGKIFFIPIDGKTYRYNISSSSGWNKDLMKDDKIFEFVDEGINEKNEYTIYKLTEYPKGNVLCAVCNNSDGATKEVFLEYYPTDKVAEGELEKAIDSGFVIMKNSSVEYNKDLWFKFYETINSGQPASVRIGLYYTLENQNMSPELYETEKNEYPCLYLQELVYDGKQYTLSPLHRNDDEYIVFEKSGHDSPVRSWKYLMHYTGKPRQANAKFTSYDQYVLMDDDTVTRDDLEFGGIMDEYIPYDVVYSEYSTE